MHHPCCDKIAEIAQCQQFLSRALKSLSLLDIDKQHIVIKALKKSRESL